MRNGRDGERDVSEELARNEEALRRTREAIDATREAIRQSAEGARELAADVEATSSRLQRIAERVRETPIAGDEAASDDRLGAGPERSPDDDVPRDPFA